MSTRTNNIESVAFQTTARTVDHLGREQIADCPTAISELWKNAYDAYARSTSLHVFDGEMPVAALCDDGHGMSASEFIDSWLVVGTASKIGNVKTPISDRNGLPPRIKQGQKGIGRLSCANIGPLLLLISKRDKENFVAALVDWRIFENPFLNLSDILVPVLEFQERPDLLRALPNLFDRLISNLGKEDEKSDRAKRLRDAWKSYDLLHAKNAEHSSELAPSESIKSTIISSSFEERHLEKWSVWTGNSSHGTALLVSEISYDLRIYLTGEADDAAAVGTKEKFFETLSCFVNPFTDVDGPTATSLVPDFSYQVVVWKENLPQVIVGSTKQFGLHQTNMMEHRIEGVISSTGEFVGRVKAFGEWRSESYRVPPPKDLRIPTTPATKVGPVFVYIAAYEFEKINTTHTDIEFSNFKELAAKYSGMMMFRDGLRVMPYGRTDNDFFEIDDRRSRNAGREFWNNRQMFGGLSIQNSQNPNLKDKAGREGILDNVAAKTLKGLIANLLMQSARQYFGSSSDIRKKLLPEISHCK